MTRLKCDILSTMKNQRREIDKVMRGNLRSTGSQKQLIELRWGKTYKHTHTPTIVLSRNHQRD